MHLDLVEMDLFSAERVEHVDFDARDDTAMIFPSFVISRKVGASQLEFLVFADRVNV